MALDAQHKKLYDAVVQVAKRATLVNYEPLAKLFGFDLQNPVDRNRLSAMLGRSLATSMRPVGSCSPRSSSRWRTAGSGPTQGKGSGRVQRSSGSSTKMWMTR